jgi:hypothetical protein
MLRYHKAVYTEPGHWQRLADFTEKLNGFNWLYNKHCLENIRYRAIDIERLLLYIKGIRLEAGAIFEYYLTDKGEVDRICYRITYNNGLDIILVMGEDKEIITIYLNSKDDLHYTLKKELYMQGEK